MSSPSSVEASAPSLNQDVTAANSCDDPIRIAFVMHVMQVAGAEILVERIIKTLGPRIDPLIICLDSVGQLGEKLVGEGIEVVSLDRQPGRDWKLVGRMIDVLKKHRTEIIHAHQYTPFFYSCIARMKGHRSSKLILTEHGRHFPDIVSTKRHWLNRLVLSRCVNRVNACSQFSGDAVRLKDGFRCLPVDVIYNGIDTKEFTASPNRPELRAELGLAPDRKYIAMVARFHPIKDHSMLLRAFQQVAKQREDVDLLLVGDGPEREQAEQFVESNNLKDRVFFWGVRNDVKKILQGIDIFTLSSISEAASLTLLEAMACERPIVTTRVGGNPELVREGVDGLLVERGNSDECAKALLQLLDDPELARQLAESARQRVIENFDWRDNVQAFDDLYKEVLER